MNSTIRGYYSIIQYCPDPSRLETVNIGVALFCPEAHFLRARFGRRRTRVRHLFGKQDWEFVEAQRIAMEARLERHEEEFQDLQSFEAFVSKRASAFRLTPPRPVKVEVPEQELQNLFIRLVGPQHETRQTAEKLISTELKSRFRAAGIEERLQSKVTVHPPFLPKPLKVPFAYRNGQLNLIEPVQFEGKTASSVFNGASSLAVEGQFIADYVDPKLGQLSLIVVANFSPDQTEERKTAEAVFQRHGVPMHTFDKLEVLIEEIKLHAHN